MLLVHQNRHRREFDFSSTIPLEPTMDECNRLTLDPHMHFWDLRDPETPHSIERIGDKVCSRHAKEDYEAAWGSTQQIHVEALPMSGMDEVLWVTRHANPAAVVAFADLSSETIKVELEALKEVERVVGIRQVLNYSKVDAFRTWPGVEMDYASDSPRFQDGLSQLEALEIPFDLQCNPGQLNSFTESLRTNSSTVIVDHLGVPQFAANIPDEASLTEWRSGLAQLARRPNSFLKISMLTHLFADNRPWWKDAPNSSHTSGLALVQEAIRIFGTNQCCFASNAPVDPSFGLTPNDSQKLQALIASAHDEQSRESLYGKSAERAYRL